jgi:TonB-linked SusC/RagA family outer membrane protein
MRKLFTSLVMLLLLTAGALAQSRSISGVVRDAKNAPIPYATVTEEGTTNSVAADNSGRFAIVTGPHSKLTITATGYQSQTVSPGSESISIVLGPGEDSMQEVVVTALGQSRSKKKVGYSSVTVSSEQLNRAAPINTLDALAGRVPGAMISRTGGPNSSSKVVFRGFGNLTGSNQPLYLIDGVPLTDARFGASSNYDFGQTISDINPNDIETISILKGTAATSIYGSQARNGAILITTKKGRSGKLKVEYAGTVNFSRVGMLPRFQDEFGQGWGGSFILSENGSWGPKFDGKRRVWGSVVDNSQLIKPFVFLEDNMREFYNTGVEINNSVSLSGGNENHNVYFSYNNVSSDGVIPTKTDFFGRNSFSLRSNNRFDRLTLNASFNYANRKVNAPVTGSSRSDGASMFEEIMQIPTDIPIKDLRDYTNKFFNVDNYFSPFAENPYYPLYENKSRQNSDRFFGSVDLNYQLTRHFSTQLRVGGDFDNARTFGYKATNAPKPGSWNGPNPKNPEGATRNPDVGSVKELTDYVGVVNGDFIVKYNNNFSDALTLEALAGYNCYQQEQRSVSAQITDLLVPGFYNLSNSTVPPTAFDASLKKRQMGVYAQTVVGLKDQVFLTLNGRNDWSSALPLGNNSVFYPGGNLSWVVSQTLGITDSRVSLLKLRGGYGKTGSDPDVYLTNPTLVVGSVQLPFGSLTLPFNGVNGFGISNAIANPQLKPVITKEAEAGVEARFFSNRVGADITVYDKNTSGQVLAVPIAPGSGYSSIIRNIGTINNRGVEVALDVRPIQSKNFTWASTVIYSRNWNKVKELTGGPDFIQIAGVYDAEMRAYPGQNAFGLYAPVPQTTADGKIIVNPQTGYALEAPEKGRFGSADYTYTAGFSTNLTFKSFQLGFLLDYRKGGLMYSGTADLTIFTGNSFFTTYNDRRPFVIPNSVYQTGVDANNKPVYAENTHPVSESDMDAYYYFTSNRAMVYKDRFIDRSFLKLRDIILSYKLPASVVSRMGMNNLMVTAYAKNILLWTPNSNVYIDPEATNLGNDFSSQFGEFRTAPMNYQLGVSLKAIF